MPRRMTTHMAHQLMDMIAGYPPAAPFWIPASFPAEGASQHVLDQRRGHIVYQQTTTKHYR